MGSVNPNSEDRLFREFGTNLDTDHALQLCCQDPLLAAHFPDQTISRIRYVLSGDSVDLARELRREKDSLASAFMFLAWVLKHQDERLAFDADELRRAISKNSPSALILDVARARQLLAAGETRSAQEVLLKTRLALRSGDYKGRPLTNILECAILFQLATAYRRACRFDLAVLALQDAEAICAAHDMLQGLQVARLRGTMLWFIGDYHGALWTHQSPGLRNRAIELRKYQWLSGSHHAACKCAVDLGMIDLAEEELEKASVALERSEVPNETGVASNALYRGEVWFHRRRFSESSQLFHQSYECFHRAGHAWGELDALTTMAEYHQLARGKPADWDVLSNLMERASDCEYHDLRARILRVMALRSTALAGNRYETVRKFIDPEMASAPAVFLDGLVCMYEFGKSDTEQGDGELLAIAHDLKPQVHPEYYRSAMGLLGSDSSLP